MAAMVAAAYTALDLVLLVADGEFDGADVGVADDDVHLAAGGLEWTTFLAREVKFSTGMRPPSADPTCDQR